MRVSTEGYALMTDRMRTIADNCDAALAFILEGGYGLDTLSEGVAMVHETFDGRRPIEPDDEAGEDVRDLVAEIRELHGLGSK
jgi:acetoin utilization deacetylase AcuC-like enzyme